ncbi:hypothetical protein N7520_004323 [Penicillium odoratum]|uniref:uncharacterized protein n=1 Tax=Penicillium odoratum TaxID=1167516 RepID=UPI00254658BE|nr:uncharacterized protein N7520_004323 [Penicillium odoratum]KAJ5764764.1 hypothetical protein N7520_004323 [Penicillium odoratum]
MSEFFRRASDAFHHRPRQDSTDSTDIKSPDTAKAPEQEQLTQKPESALPDSHNNNPTSGIATGLTENVTHPKQRHLWGWDHRQGKKPETKQQSRQEQKENTDWIMGT